MKGLIGQLIDTLGESQVLVGEDCAPYECDGRGDGGRAIAVVRPRTTVEVSECARIARQHDIATMPLGGRSGLVGAGLAAGHLVISLDRLADRIEINAQNRTATVSAGVHLSQLNDAAAEFGLCFPIDLGADPSIGGMVACNTGGARFLRYGDVRRSVLGLQVVLVDDHGTVLECGRGLWKDNSELDLKQLFISSAGSLGLVTQATIALQPLPACRVTAMIALEQAETSLGLLERFEREFGAMLTAFEGVSYEALDIVRRNQGRQNVPFARIKPGFVILIELSGPQAVSTDLLIEKLSETLAPGLENGCLLDAVIDEKNGLWDVRHAIPESLRSYGQVVACDVSTKRGDLMAFRDLAKAEVARRWPKLTVADFGHIGDGGLHFNMVWSPEADPFPDHLAEEVRNMIFDLVVNKFGGSFSAEHGLGSSNQSIYHRYASASCQALAGKIQKIVAPYGVGRVNFGPKEETKHVR